MTLEQIKYLSCQKEQDVSITSVVSDSGKLLESLVAEIIYSNIINLALGKYIVRLMQIQMIDYC